MLTVRRPSRTETPPQPGAGNDRQAVQPDERHAHVYQGRQSLGGTVLGLTGNAKHHRGAEVGEAGAEVGVGTVYSLPSFTRSMSSWRV